MVLHIYNTLTHQKEEFTPRRGRRVDMFVCGITPQDSAHMGHARTYVAFDVVVKYLRSKGYHVLYLQNVTDVEDRIINRAKEKRISEGELAEHFFLEYLEVMGALGVDAVNVYARATDYIPEIIEQIQGLISRKYAYVADDASVYFDTTKYPEWGKLSGQKVEGLIAGARVAVDERKRHASDFVLWKAQKPGEPAWDSPWGPGRPGWHIEDTAISIRHFGPQYDLHGGGIDLQFPHHEAEIAQAEALTGVKPFVRFWMHTGHLNIQGEKMSKSLRNFITIRDALTRFPPRVVRFFFLNMHYRSPLDYTEEGLEEARRALARLSEARGNLVAALRAPAERGAGDGTMEEATTALSEGFEEAMDDDFNTREAIAALFTFTTAVNQALAKGVGAKVGRRALEALESADSVLGVLGEAGAQGREEALLNVLVEARDRARKKNDYDTSDYIREALQSAGFTLEDTSSGPRLKRRP